MITLSQRGRYLAMHHGGGGGGSFGGHGHGAHHGGHHSGHATHHHHGGAPSQSASWNMAMQAPEFWVKLFKEKQKPILVVGVGTMTMVLWLYMIHYLNAKENPHHVVSNATWNEQLTAADPQSAALSGANESTSPFGSPISASAAQPTNYESQGYSGGAPATGAPPAMPSMAAAMMSSYMPSGYAAAQNPMAQSLSASPYGASMRGQSFGIMPVRQHSAERFKVVVQR